MSQSHRASLPEIYMKVLDPDRIKKYMVIKDISARQLATAAGWKSHTYMLRILDGKIRSVQPTPAARIANCLGVGIDDLFVTRTTNENGQSGKRRHAA